MHVSALTHSSGVPMMKSLSSKLIKSRHAPARTSVATTQWISSGESVLFFNRFSNLECSSTHLLSHDVQPNDAAFKRH